ncbi:glycosyltransferase family 9 protein [Candidatus Nucleicultrix amoebiphila]|uniref:glycosyltransferase family 9 protein n=1 Tax=Candidatus Nucleicultrix amoebiphila TaxID=1509244 RepID=UPI000A2690FC|nr:glycosyltransferase family 9 protein [Candidatus Nucleicultrix amoebiphila]
MKTQQHILVIKHGALGDMINSLGAFKVIRKHHRNDHITLLTDPAYVKFVSKTPYFDEIITDRRDRLYLDFFKHRKVLKTFQRIYDLQTSRRSSLYFKLLGPGQKPEWSGIAEGCKFRQTRSDRDFIHAFLRFADQLKIAGLKIKGEEDLYPDLSWLKLDVGHFNIPEKSVLLIPGSSKGGASKRWPALKYADLSNRLIAKGWNPVLIAGPDDQEVASVIREKSPQILDLSLKTNFFEIIGIARKAVAIVGNDTGPTHLSAYTKSKTLILWSSFSDPNVFAPRGPNVHVLHYPNLEELSVEKVFDYLIKVILKSSEAIKKVKRGCL